ncbi:hypothetical protein RD792_008434, partial [Penstemon davidsonii]
RNFQEDDETDEEEEEEHIIIKGRSFRDVESITKQVNCITINKREHKKPCEDILSWERYDIWRQEQKSGAARLKKQLKARWAMQKLIDEQLSRFEAHYKRAMAPTKMSNVAQLLMPKWIPAHELAALSWLGDWRPSTILEFLHSLSHSLSDPVGVERALSQLINDIRIEEAVIDEEMTEIQATCVLNLPFGPKSHRSEPALARVMSEFKKIHRVIVKAQNLRIKALQLAVNNVLSQTDAAEFLVDFAGIQDAIHHVATKYKTGKGPQTGRSPKLNLDVGIVIQEASGIANISNDPSNLNSQETFKHAADQYMPISSVIKIMRQVLPPHAKIADDAKETIQECVSELIRFITRNANVKSHKEWRTTITPENIISTMGSLGFDNYVEPITTYLNKIRNQEAELNSVEGFPFVKRSAIFKQPEHLVTQPPPPPPPSTGYAPSFTTYLTDPNNYERSVTQPPPPSIGYSPSFTAYPIDPNNYVGSSQMNSNYIQNFGAQGGSSSDNFEFDPFKQFK